VPVPENVTAFLMECERDERREARDGEPVLEVLARFVQQRVGAPVSASVWENAEVPPHLLMNFRVVDDAGRELATGRDLAALKAQLGQAAQLTFGRAETGIERDNIRAWDFGDLPGEIAFTRNGRRLTGYPGLADEEESVAIRLFDVKQAAETATRAGVRRLMQLALKEQMRQLERSLRGVEQAALRLRGVGSADVLKEDLIAAIADRAFLGEDALPRTAKEFEAQLKRARTRLPAVSEGACRLYAAIAEDYQRVTLRLNDARGPLSRLASELRAQLARLIHKGYFSATPWNRLADLPRYLQAMQLRLDKFAANPERDAKHAAAIAGLWARYEERLEKQKKAGAVDPRLDEYRWHIEELRVSLFAQELKTPYPVSFKRLDRIWNAIR
jgi:ATP-dependent helicase HrpA